MAAIGSVRFKILPCAQPCSYWL